MIRLLIAALGLPILPVFLGLLSWASPSSVHLVWAPSRNAVWEIRAGQDAQMEALKEQIKTLQGRVTAVNERLAASIAALESEPR